MFTDNKYRRFYDEMMADARADRTLTGHADRHHIVPRSLGGSDEKVNIVDLTFQEHFVAHWLLTKFTTGEPQAKMRMALNCMSPRSKTDDPSKKPARRGGEVFDESDPDLISPRALAKWFGVSSSWPALARNRGDGPPFRHSAERGFYYSRSEVTAWIETRTGLPVDPKRSAQLSATRKATLARKRAAKQQEVRIE